VAVISPWNFPFAIGGFWSAAPALLEGNTVVFKPSEDTPMVGQIIAELYNDAGFPPGVFNLIHGDGQVGERLVNSDVDHIVFTGSAAVGRKIKLACATASHKTCSCEMGSKAAVMVFDDADMDLALSACFASAYKLSGQRCVSSGRILIQRGVYDAFCEKFAHLSRRVSTGNDLEQGAPVTYGPLINKAQLERVMGFNDMVRNSNEIGFGNCEVLLEGHRPQCKGYYLLPFVYKHEWKITDNGDCGKNPYLQQEVFGPHVALVPFDDTDDAIRIYNDTEYGLSLGVITSDFKKAREVRNRCDFGLGYWNLGSIGAESHLPFGGVKASGYGWPSAAGTFDAVVHEVSWTTNYGGLTFPQGLT
jgi:aldehyde dehydrogenase (NAD+)